MILVDTSIWIEYFKGNPETIVLNELIDRNSICVNDLILSELLPSIAHKQEVRLGELLKRVHCVPLTINWKEIVLMQTLNLKNGVNRVGIPDLIIAQNAIENNVEIFTRDKHFELMSSIHGIRLFSK